jgi:hypothetical protein
LFEETNKMVLTPGGGSGKLSGSGCDEWLRTLNPVDVWHHLIARGPPELELPHTRMRWSLQRYSRWLDEKQPEEVWFEIKRSLEAYAAQVDARGEQQYHPVYPILLSLGPALLSVYHAQSYQ